MQRNILLSKIQDYFQRWMSERSPRADQVTLQHRTIYVFPSKQGAAFLLLILVIWILGTNYQNNLILGMSFFLTSLMLVSVVHAFRNLLGLSFSPGSVRHAVVDEFVAFEVEVSSKYSSLHYGLVIQADGDSEPVRIDLNGNGPTKTCLLIKASRRGWMAMPRIILKSYYPFGLIRAWAYIDLRHRALIFPKPIKSDAPPLGIGEGHEGSFLSKQSGDEFQGFQNYQPGSPLSQISWKHYARGAGLHLKDYRALQSNHFWLDWHALEGLNVELALSHLSYWIHQFSENNIEFGLRMPRATIALGSGDVHRISALTELALFGNDRGEL